jgi:6,7-dimethyl-8-ribityllumazine synthase
MATVIEGDYTKPRGRFALLAARFNGFIVEQLIKGAVDGLVRHGVSDQDIDLVRVPGSYEVPLIARNLAASKKYAAIIALGAIIRGETDHYDHVAAEASRGIAKAAQETGIPIIFGILTCDTLEQAINRAGAKAGNKGFESALSAIEMVNLLDRLSG